MNTGIGLIIGAVLIGFAVDHGLTNIARAIASLFIEEESDGRE